MPQSPFSNINIPVSDGWDLIAGMACFMFCAVLPVHFESYGLGQGAIVGDNTAQLTNKGLALLIAGVVGGSLSSAQSSGKWVQRNESMSDSARAYQRFISGRTDDMVYELNGYTFDGFDAQLGILKDAKDIPVNFIDKATGQFRPWVSGQTDWLTQAQNQINAAGGLQIQWYFTSQLARDAMYNLFMKSNPTLLKSIELIHKPVTPTAR